MLIKGIKRLMDVFGIMVGEPPKKRQRVSEYDAGPTIDGPEHHQTKGEPADDATANATWESSFSFDNASPPDAITLDITKFIPVGCLRMHMSDCKISTDVWASCNSWFAFVHPRDPIQPSRQLPSAALQNALLKSSIIWPFSVLFHAGWIKMEFKTQGDCGQARVYILPDDVGRASVDRQRTALRRSMQTLLARLDVSKSTWRGEWSDDTRILHVDSTLDEYRNEDEPSLFYMFNTLPSPNPDPEAVSDPYTKWAMDMILDSDIEGLKTVMYNYQRRSAAIMLQREVEPGQTVDPRLVCLEDQRGVKWYCDIDSGSCLLEARTYETARGGILAETMGLGKTLICLAVILATRDIPSKIPVEFSVGAIPVRKSTGSLKDMAAAAVGRTGTPWKNHFSDLQGGYTHDLCVDAIKKNAGHYFIPSPAPRRQSRNPVIEPPRKIWLTAATLVIVPANLVQQWRHEIKKHTTGLKCLVIKDKKDKLPPPEELVDFDIILFSKSRFEQEAKDGSDNQGRRRSTTTRVCRCPYIADTRIRDCTCFREEEVYHSPLKSLHFKRLITDEGHTFGNSARTSTTTAVMVVDFLQLDARWIASGTPTQGLYGAEVAIGGSNSSSTVGTPLPDSNEHSPILTNGLDTLTDLPDDDLASNSSKDKEKLFYVQERKDLEKLGNIASVYLKARPWAPSFDQNDTASWAQYVMQPRHGSKSRGNMKCLEATLESMIIRHRPDDYERDVRLPPLYQDVVHLEGSLQDKLSLNTFSMMIVSNAVTSERKDADYLFHPRQRAPLNQLVSNLRQASFFWSGYTTEDVKVTLDIAKQFLEKREVAVSGEDEVLLRQAIHIGEVVLQNSVSQAISEYHEMPMYVESEISEEIRLAWALDKDSRNPTLMGATMIHEAQKFVESHLWKEDPTEGMVAAGHSAMIRALAAQDTVSNNRSSKSQSRDAKNGHKAAIDLAPTLAGGVAIGDGSSLKKRPSSKPLKPLPATSFDRLFPHSKSNLSDVDEFIKPKPESVARQRPATPKSALKKSGKPDIVGTLNPSSSLTSASIVSTASAKLSYLMDRILIHQTDEKILVFYEADNVAYYIAQALECLGIKYLIYAKSIDTARRSQYVVTFNQTETFRVLLMDVSQAAFGLDMSSASRVYFINPVFSPQVEAQAVKRAHRIGQTKPVYVETLVLKGSIEELILERKKDMSNEEHTKLKSILDDQSIFDWIRNSRFLPVTLEEVPGPEQMAKLATPQLVFGRGSSAILDPDADLVMGDLSPKAGRNAKGKGKAVAIDAGRVTFAEASSDGPDRSHDALVQTPIPVPGTYRLHSSGRTLFTGVLSPGSESQGNETHNAEHPSTDSGSHVNGAGSTRIDTVTTEEPLPRKRKAVAFADQDDNDDDDVSSPPARKVRFETPPPGANVPPQFVL